MKRRWVACAAALYGALVATGAGAGCEVSDWPVDVPRGPGALVRSVEPARAIATHMVVVRRSAGPPREVSVPAPAHRAAPRQVRRDWLAARHKSPDAWERLIYAVEDENAARAAAALRSRDIDVNAPLNSTTRQSLLDLAAAGNEAEVVRLLLEHGAHVRAQPGERVDVRPIATAMLALRNTLSDPTLSNPYTGAVRTPAGSVAIIRVLLDAGADPDTRFMASEDLTPLGSLMLMPRFDGDLALARLLVRHGASVEGSRAVRSPLRLAIERGNEDYAQLFLDGGRISAGGLSEALIAAASRQNGPLAEKLLAAGADPDAGSDGRPLLCSTLLSGERRQIALALLVHGANANADCGGPRIGEQTPLTLVKDTDHELIDLLVGRGGRLRPPSADEAALTAHGVYPGPLTWAVLHHRDYVAARLIARDPRSAQAECGLVIYAAASGAKLTLAELFRHGADANASTTSGITALMVAAYHGDTGVLKVLVAQPGIDLDRTTPWHFNSGHFTPQFEGEAPPLRSGSRTALMFAALSGSSAAAELLVSRGARVHQTDAEGLQALDYARSPEVARVLSVQ